MNDPSKDPGADNGAGFASEAELDGLPTRDGPFPVVDPVEDLSKASPAARVAILERQLEAAALDRATGADAQENEQLRNHLGTARAGLAELVALSTNPGWDSTKLGAKAKALLDALPVT